MTTFLPVFAIMTLAMVGMTVGVMMGRRQLSGSCGGLSAVMNENGEKVCGVCGISVASPEFQACSAEKPA